MYVLFACLPVREVRTSGEENGHGVAELFDRGHTREHTFNQTHFSRSGSPWACRERHEIGGTRQPTAHVHYVPLYLYMIIICQRRILSAKSVATFLSSALPTSSTGRHTSRRLDDTFARLDSRQCDFSLRFYRFCRSRMLPRVQPLHTQSQSYHSHELCGVRRVSRLCGR